MFKLELRYQRCQPASQSKLPMHTNETVSEIDIEDIPWPSWAIAGCLTIVIAVVSARLWSMWDDAPNRELSIQLALVIILVIAFFIFATRTALSCSVDRTQRTVTVARGGLLDSSSVVLSFQDIATCFTEQWKQADGTSYRIGLRLRSGETLPITAWKRDHQEISQLCLKIRRSIGSS